MIWSIIVTGAVMSKHDFFKQVQTRDVSRLIRERLILISGHWVPLTEVIDAFESLKGTATGCNGVRIGHPTISSFFVGSGIATKNPDGSYSRSNEASKEYLADWEKLLFDVACGLPTD